MFRSTQQPAITNDDKWVKPGPVVVLEQDGVRYRLGMPTVTGDGEVILENGEEFEEIRRNVTDPITPGYWTNHVFLKKSD